MDNGTFYKLYQQVQKEAYMDYRLILHQLVWGVPCGPVLDMLPENDTFMLSKKLVPENVILGEN